MSGWRCPIQRSVGIKLPLHIISIKKKKRSLAKCTLDGGSGEGITETLEVSSHADDKMDRVM
jgi:hypothetical protein